MTDTTTPARLDPALAQPGILAPVPPHGRYLWFSLADVSDLRRALQALAERVDGESEVVGLGAPLVRALGATVPGLRDAPSYRSGLAQVPSTTSALWCWLRGEDRGELLHRSRKLAAAVAPGLRLEQALDGFVFRDSRDLTGFVDGTENPKDDKAFAAAIAQGQGEGLDGGSYVAVMQWLHDFERFEKMTADDQDVSIGRHMANDAEIADAPPSAHVKRTAQESFEPEAFVLRRSVPWSEGTEAGLVFVAFGKSFDAFDAQLARMAGVGDGVTDALFRFTKPLSHAWFWCPPVREGRIDLRLVGI